MTQEGVKRSAALFQSSAGLFAKLKQELAGDHRVSPPPDLSDATCGCMENLMLAQAQECFWAKAVIDKLKDGTIAKLAAQVSDYYGQALVFARDAKLQPSITVHLAAKQAHFDAASQYRQALLCSSESKFGEEVARLRMALASASRVDQKELAKHCAPAVLADLKALIERTGERLASAEKDNNVVYIQTVPPAESLHAVSRAALASPTAFPPPLLDGSDALQLARPPFFERLVPFSVHRALSVYSAARDALITSEDGKLKAATEAAWNQLASMNLPGALDALEQPIGLPSSLLNKANEVRTNGGAKALEAAWDRVRNHAEMDSDLLKEAERLLDDEKSSDEACRNHYGTKWTRPSSDTIASNLRDSLKGYADKLEQARKSDRLVRTKLDRFLPGILALDGSKEQLEASVPAASARSSLAKTDPTVALLRSQVAQLGSIISAREGIVARMRELAVNEDAGGQLAGMASRGEAVDTESARAKLLSKYDPSREEARMSLEAQKSMLDAIARSFATFASARGQNPVLLDRERALQNLDMAYKAWKDIKGNLEEGQKFYTDFRPVLERFRASCADFSEARRIEMGDLTRMLALGGSMSSLRLSNADLGQMGQPSPSASPSAPPLSDVAAPGGFPEDSELPPYEAPKGGWGILDPK